MSLKVEYRIGISAPVDNVYDVLADIESWPSWSPIHKIARGHLGFGAPITLSEYFEGLGTWDTEGFIADWTPLSHIHISVPKPFYAGRLTRYFELEVLSDTGTTFSLGAVFDGFLSEREGRAYRKYLIAGFEKTAEALKAKVEADWREARHNAPPRHIPVDEPEPPPPRTKPLWAPPKLFGHK